MSNTSGVKDTQPNFTGGVKASTFPDVKSKTSAAFDQAKAKASSATSETAGSVHDFVEDQKNAGAETMKNVAHAVQGAAESFEDRAPGVSQVARKVAQNLETASDSLQNTSIDEIGRNLTDFARRQPLTAMAGAFVAGMVVSRIFSGRSA